MIGERYAVEVVVVWDPELALTAGSKVWECIERAGWLWQPQDASIYAHPSIVAGEVIVSALVQPMQLPVEHEMDDEIIEALLHELREDDVRVRGITVARYLAGGVEQ